jgi:hypothetical protein
MVAMLIGLIGTIIIFRCSGSPEASARRPAGIAQQAWSRPTSSSAICDRETGSAQPRRRTVLATSAAQRRPSR